MLRFLIRPRWLLVHAAFMAAIAFCLVAGWWQFGVFEQSEGRHDERERAPVPISQLVRPDQSIGDGADRPVTAQGSYLSEHQLLVHGRVHDRTLGWFVVVPFETESGAVVPVVRGWVMERDDAVPPRAPDTTITGHLLSPETPEHATVRTGQTLAEDELGYVSPDTVAEATGLSAGSLVQGYVLLAAEEPSPDDVTLLDVDNVAPIRDVNPWQNLSYWAQWWVFALAALVFWASAVRSGIRTRRNGDRQPGAEGDATELNEPAAPRVPS